MKNWWKILCVVLLGWAFTAGLLVPLRTGVMGVTPLTVRVGDTVWLTVDGYNSQWDKPENAKAWLHIDEYFKVEKEGKKVDSSIVYSIVSQQVKAIDARHIAFLFYIPKHLPTPTKLENASILVDVAGNDKAIRPVAIAITQDSMNAAAGKAAWNAPMKVFQTWSFKYPYRNILAETLRNTFYHVPMWFVMFTLFGIALYNSIQYLRKRNNNYDRAAVAFTQTGVLFGLLGLFTGGMWANYAWGKPFPMDIKIIMTYTALAIYFAYFILRGAFEDEEKKARISAVYSVFAFMTLVPLLYVVPKLAPDSLHPGNGTNIAFGTQDLDNTMRMVFYPASIGWILLGIWIATLVNRYLNIKEKMMMG
jgi:heme exporter protein C